MKTTRHEMVKPGAQDTSTVVWFTVIGADLVRVYTWGAHTDYTTSFEMSKAEARQAWRDLIASGFTFTRSFESTAPAAVDPDLYA